MSGLNVGPGGGKVGASLARQMIATLEEMSPGRVVLDALHWLEEGSLLEVCGKPWPVHEAGIWILGSGKAAISMTQSAVDVLGESVQGGLVLAPRGGEETVESELGESNRREGGAESTRHPDRIGPVLCRYGSHPLPEEANREATSEMTLFGTRIPKGALVIYLLSGGSSALLCAPPQGVSVEDLRQVHQGLLRSGATIHEMNLVRKALSHVKAGQLLPHLAHTRLVDLVISDVPGDSLLVIGSAPTTSCPIEPRKAMDLLKEKGLWECTPDTVRAVLKQMVKERGAEWRVDSAPELHEQHMVGSASMLAERVAARLAQSLGKSSIRGEEVQLHVAETAYDGPIGEVAREMARQIIEAGTGSLGSLPILLVWYGESTVQVSGTGKGGRNQELALRVAVEMGGLLAEGSAREIPWTFVSLATDGVDGPTDSAGGVVHEGTLELAHRLGVDLNEVIRDNDAWHALERLEAHLRTGPTGHNLMDLQVALIGVPQEREIA